MGVDVTRVLSSGDPAAETYRSSDELRFTKEQADAVLEAAYLSAAANGDLSDAELVNFRALVPRVEALSGSAASPKEPTNAELRALLDRYDGNLRHTDVPSRLRALAALLTTTPHRELTYKLAFALSICDLATDDDEADFLDDLCEAFDLSKTVDRLTAEVYEALDDGSGDDEPA